MGPLTKGISQQLAGLSLIGKTSVEAPRQCIIFRIFLTIIFWEERVFLTRTLFWFLLVALGERSLRGEVTCSNFSRARHFEQFTQIRRGNKFNLVIGNHVTIALSKQ